MIPFEGASEPESVMSSSRREVAEPREGKQGDARSLCGGLADNESIGQGTWWGAARC